MAVFKKYLMVVVTILIQQYVVIGAPVTENFLPTKMEPSSTAPAETNVERQLDHVSTNLKHSLDAYCSNLHNKSTLCDPRGCQEFVEQYKSFFGDFVISNVSQSLINSYHQMQRMKMDICMEETFQIGQDSRFCCCSENYRYNVRSNDLNTTCSAGYLVDQMRNLLQAKNLAVSDNDCVIPSGENCTITDIVNGPQREVQILLAFASAKQLLDNIINQRP